MKILMNPSFDGCLTRPYVQWPMTKGLRITFAIDDRVQNFLNILW